MNRHNYTLISAWTIIITIFSALTAVGGDIRSDYMPDTAAVIQGDLLPRTAARKAEAMTAFALLFTRNQQLSARKQLLTALRNDPNSRTLLQLVLLAMKKNGVDKEFRRSLQQIAASTPRAYSLNLLIVSDLARHHQYKEAIKLAEKSLATVEHPEKLNSKNFKLYTNIILLLGSLYGEHKMIVPGEKLFDAILNNRYLADDFTILRGALAFYHRVLPCSSQDKFLWFWESEHDRIKQQEKLVKQHLISLPLTVKQTLTLANDYEQLGMTPEAENLLLNYLIKHDANPVIMTALTQIYYRDKDGLAMPYSRTLYEISPEKHLYVTLATFSALRSGFKIDAIHYLQTYFKRNKPPGSFLDALQNNAVSANISRIDYPLVLRLIRLYNSFGNFAAAIKLLDSLPNSPVFVYEKGDILLREGKYHEALHCLQQAENNKLFTKLPIYFAITALIAADYCKRNALIKKYAHFIVNKYPDLRKGYANTVGYILANRNLDLPLADKLLTFAIKQTPKNPAVEDSMAWLRYRQQRYRDALSYIQQSLKHSGDYPHAVIAAHAGDIYYALKDYHHALHYWRLALKIYGPDLDRKQVKRKIAALKNVKR